MEKARIEEFLSRLEGKEGCDFREGPNGPTWICEGGADKSLSRKILRSMLVPEEEAEAFLRACDDMGGHCDCEIVFNAADRLREGA
jgi:hypothetical protein